MTVKKTLLKCLLAGTAAFAAAVTVQADSAQEAKSAYAQFLEENDYWAEEFALDDIDSDGISELRIAGTYGFYEYYNGSVTDVTDVKAILDAWYPETGAIFYSRGFKDGSYSEWACVLENGYWGEICSKNIFPDNTISYYGSNSIPISENEYYAIVEAYSVGEAKIPFQQMLQNTAENRSMYPGTAHP